MNLWYARWSGQGGTHMKINEAEQTVGISKKNIRFYEEAGLLSPSRSANGYRDYGSADVEILKQIKLLRKLDISLEEIRRLLLGDLTLEDCLKRHQIVLERRAKNLENITAFCRRLLAENKDFGTLSVDELLLEMDNMEEGGTKFMDFQIKDKKKRKRGALIGALLIVPFMAFFSGITIWGLFIVPGFPVGIAIVFLAIPALIIASIIYVLKERFKEIEGGEIYEASKY